MKIAIIDADLIGRKKHRFPNLVCMKLSGYYKERNCEVELKLDYENLESYDKVFISKVFTDTPIDETLLKLPNVEYGGTGFYFDKAPNLPDEVEHHMPDYHLYDEWVNAKIESGESRTQFKEYLDYSIGFITRGCFRKCAFCVNQKYSHVFKHSPLSEFYDPTRKKICLLDDNFLGCPDWKEMLQELIDTGKPFKFKQGMDERILTEEKCQMLFGAKYDGDYTFAFDNIADKALIIEKLEMIKKYSGKIIPKFYVLVGFDHNDKWNDDFWLQDQLDMWDRIETLMRYGCLPYIMRFNRYEDSPYRGMYIQVCRWCNQPSFFKKKSLREYVFEVDKGKAAMKYLDDFETKHPDIAKKYFDMKWMDFNE